MHPAAFFALLIGSIFAQSLAAQTRGLDLFRKLATTSLDGQRVLHIRDCDLDLEDLHISLEEGTLGFTQPVEGRVTGALFMGEGSVLTIPPNLVERASLTRFTKSAVLNERLHSAFLRFNDENTAKQLESCSRGPDAAAEDFVSKYDSLVKTLAETDALRLAISRLNGDTKRFVRARIAGDHLGVFEAMYDQASPESILVVQGRRINGLDFEDVWLSFASRSQRTQAQNSDQVQADQNGISRQFAIEHYDIDVKVAPPTDISATARLTVSAYDKPIKAALLQLSSRLKVSSAKLDGQVIEFLQNPAVPGSQTQRSGNDVIAIILPSPLMPGATHQLEFTYSGAVMTDTGGGLLYVGDRGTWYPNLGFHNATFDLRYQVPPPWKLVSTGEHGAEADLHFTTPHAVPVAGFNVGRFTEATSAPKVGAVNIAVLATKSEGDAAVPLQEIVTRSSAVVDYLQQHLGPFPYRQLSISEVPGGISQGWPSLIYLSTQAFNTPKLGAEPRTEFARIVFEQLMLPHEIGHQYWGDNVAWRSYRDQWIMEALTNYCALMYLEQRDPTVTESVLQHYRAALTRTGVSPAPVTLGQRLNSSQAPEGYTLETYGRGTWLVHMLRHMLHDSDLLNKKANDADDTFWTALRSLQTNYVGRPIGESELQTALQQALGARKVAGLDSLDWFFSGWVNGDCVPQLTLAKSRITGNTASGTIDLAGCPKDITVVVPLYAEKADGSKELAAQVVADEAESEFKIKVPPATKNVLLDPFHEVLRREAAAP